MEKLTIKTEEAINAYKVLSTAKYSKMDDCDKIKAWKIARVLKPIADKFDDDTRDAAETFKPSADFGEKLQKAQEFERMTKVKDFDASKLPMGVAEYDAFVKEFQKYKKLIDEAIKEFAEKEVEVEFEKLTEDAFCKLMASNDWTIEQVTKIGMIVV